MGEPRVGAVLADVDGTLVTQEKVLTDRAILGIASAKPSTLSELLKVHGVGPSVLDKYGRKVLDLIAER